MLKKLLSAVGIGAGLAYSYYRGYWSGFEKARLVYFDEAGVIEDEDIESDETSSEEDTEETTEESLEDTSEEQVECEDEDCTESFDSEQGMKIHFGRVHKSDED